MNAAVITGAHRPFTDNDNESRRDQFRAPGPHSGRTLDMAVLREIHEFFEGAAFVPELANDGQHLPLTRAKLTLGGHGGAMRSRRVVGASGALDRTLVVLGLDAGGEVASGRRGLLRCAGPGAD